MNHDLMFDAFIFLTASVVSVPIAKRLGLGSVLGYLIAGIIIGPYLLNVIGKTENVMHVAEFGVVLMLFLIGLELKPALLWQLKGPIVGLGGVPGLQELAQAQRHRLPSVPPRPQRSYRRRAGTAPTPGLCSPPAEEEPP
mgnify:CR=1 FL=1